MRNNLEQKLTGIKQPEDTNSPSMITGLSFVVPTHYVDLPSRGKFYQEGHPLYNKTSIEIKEMTAREEDILTSESYIKNGVTMDKLVESILVDKSLDQKSIFSIDKTAILIAARISAYGNIYKVSVSCKKCNNENVINYDLEKEVEYKFAEEDLELNNGYFLITLPNAGWNVYCKLISSGDESKTIQENKEGNVSSTHLSNIIYSINEVTDKKILQQAISAIPMKDTKFLRDAYSEKIPSVKLKHNFHCQSCEHEEVLEVPVTLNFFWPMQ